MSALERFVSPEDVWLGEMVKFATVRDIRALQHAVGVAAGTRLDEGYIRRWARRLRWEPGFAERGIGRA